MGDQSEEPQRPSIRSSLRNATFIDPSSGARLKKSFTLHDYDGTNDRPYHRGDTENTPLLNNAGDSSGAGRLSQFNLLQRTIVDKTRAFEQFALSDTGKGVFKCALAYLIGSLATFIPALSEMFGRNDSKHLVATITVYFHPARSLGSMIDAIFLACVAFVYTAFISFLSMSVAAFFADTVHIIIIGHAIVLFVFVGGGLGFIGWVKLKKGDPLVNVACSLTSLALITILTKEGAVQAGDFSVQKITSILKMIAAGSLATMLVSFLVFPISARRKLKQNFIDVTDSLADMLALITSSFISGDEGELEDQVLTKISEQQKKTFAMITQNLKEAKYEHYLLGTEQQSRKESKLSTCIQRITQSVGGLRSAAAMQFVIVNQPAMSMGKNVWRASAAQPSAVITPAWRTTPLQKQLSTDQVLEQADRSRSSPVTRQELDLEFRTPSQIFDLFIDHLGPSMRSLAFTLKEILDDLPFDPERGFATNVNPKFKISLGRALDLYKQARGDALLAVYDKKDMEKHRPMEVEADWEEAAACCGHFSFSLLEVAEEIRRYLRILDELQLVCEEEPTSRTWGWLKFWQRDPNRFHAANLDPQFSDVTVRADELDVYVQASVRRGSPAGLKNPYEGKRGLFKRRIFRKIYEGLAFFREEDIRFAIKVGFGAMLYALPSFIEVTRPIYSHWRGEWGLLSYMLVCSMTIGAANTTGYSRILGTCLGAILACIAWEIAEPNPFILATIGFCMAYWTAYIIIGQGKGPMGRFIMLTYNLSALYAYSLTMQDDLGDGDEEDNMEHPLIFPIAYHRVVAVISGCIWGLIITRLVWPISARQKLKDGLSLTWLRMGMIWKRDPLSILIDGEHPNQYMNLREELELQRYLLKLQALSDAAVGEFELRGVFPRDIYDRILKSTSRMLDAFHAMNMVLLKDLHASTGEEALLHATLYERSQLCSRISHLFGVLASSMKLEYPILNDALPNIEHARDRLLARIFTYRKEHTNSQQTSDEDFSMLYTYALVTGQIALEIERVLKEVENLFGILDEEALRLQ